MIGATKIKVREFKTKTGYRFIFKYKITFFQGLLHSWEGHLVLSKIKEEVILYKTSFKEQNTETKKIFFLNNRRV